MKKIVLAASMATLFTGSVQADAIGVYLGGQYWDNSVSGIFGESGNQVDFNLSDEQQTSFFLAFEHPLPFIPNAKIATTTLETIGSTVLADGISFGGEDFAVGAQVDANFDVSYIDYTLYYELFDNGLISFDLGLTARDFDGDITVSSLVNTAPSGDAPAYVTTTGTLATDEIVPMLYASTSIGLPFTGVNIFAEGNFLSLGDHTLYDYQAGVNYELVDNLLVDVNLTMGYRALKLELEDVSDLYTDIEFKGVFAGVIVHF